MQISMAPVRDNSGRELVRTATAESGWVYLSAPIEFTCGLLNSSYMKDYTGSDRYTVSEKFYDVNGNELATQPNIASSCVKSVITIYIDHDYEVVAGKLFHPTRPLTDVRVYGLFGAFNPADDSIISAREMIGGINLKHVDPGTLIYTDGRSPKYMKMTTEGVGVNTNTVQFIITHGIGVQEEFTLLLELYRS